MLVWTLREQRVKAGDQLWPENTQHTNVTALHNLSGRVLRGWIHLLVLNQQPQWHVTSHVRLPQVQHVSISLQVKRVWFNNQNYVCCGSYGQPERVNPPEDLGTAISCTVDLNQSNINNSKYFKSFNKRFINTRVPLHHPTLGINYCNCQCVSILKFYICMMQVSFRLDEVLKQAVLLPTQIFIDCQSCSWGSFCQNLQKPASNVTTYNLNQCVCIFVPVY